MLILISCLECSYYIFSFVQFLASNLLFMPDIFHIYSILAAILVQIFKFNNLVDLDLNSIYA